MLLALVVVSGILSEAVIRRLRLAPALPDELVAGQPTLLGATLQNLKRWTPSLFHHARAPRRGRHAPLHLHAAYPRRRRAPGHLGGHVTPARPPSSGRRAHHHAVPVRHLPQGGAGDPPGGAARVPVAGARLGAASPRAGRERRRAHPPPRARQRPAQPARLSGGRRPAAHPLALQRQDAARSPCGRWRPRPRSTPASCWSAAAIPPASRRASRRRRRSPFTCCARGRRWRWRAPGSRCRSGADPSIAAAS